MTIGRDRMARLAPWGTVLVWLLCAAMQLWVDRHYIQTVDFRDPDDALRLVEVRNWLAGQSWFDVTQYRSHPPTGAPMHWSRLVDIPIAFFIRLYGLFAATPMAERLALVTVPLLMLGGLFAILHSLTVRVTGRPLAGVVAATLLAASVGVLVQFSPLRIDHHGWQITLTLLAVRLALAGRPERRARDAALAGLVMAVNLTIALESLPLAVAIGGVLGLRYLRRRDAFAGLLLYLFMLGGGAALLLPAMLGWTGAAVPWCDAMSPAYALPLLLVALLFGGIMRLSPQGTMWQRLLCLAVAGGAGALLFARAAPQCLGGPFSMLDPLVYRLWYTGIREGMPVWTQPVDIQMLVTLPGLLGLAGTLLALRSDGAARRDRWVELLIVQGIAFAVSMSVTRAMGLAHVLAMPGNAWLFLAALRTATRLQTPVGRVLLGFCCFGLTPLGSEVLGMAVLTSTNKAGDTKKDNKAAGLWDICVTRRGFVQLDRLPPAELMTPLDIGSHILAFTHHSVVATGHHRNVAGMKTVISFFIADPGEAHAIIAKTPARYVGFCPTEKEARRYASENPRGMMALLLQDRPPSWLQRISMERKDDIRFYRLVD